jgi:hypothetical protein
VDCTRPALPVICDQGEPLAVIFAVREPAAAPRAEMGTPPLPFFRSWPILLQKSEGSMSSTFPPSAHKGPQMLDERARLRGTPAMGRHKGVDRQRRAAPSGERLDERAALEIVADQQFGREADP